MIHSEDIRTLDNSDIVRGKPPQPFKIHFLIDKPLAHLHLDLGQLHKRERAAVTLINQPKIGSSPFIILKYQLDGADLVTPLQPSLGYQSRVDAHIIWVESLFNVVSPFVDLEVSRIPGPRHWNRNGKYKHTLNSSTMGRRVGTRSVSGSNNMA